MLMKPLCRTASVPHCVVCGVSMNPALEETRSNNNIARNIVIIFTQIRLKASIDNDRAAIRDFHGRVGAWKATDGAIKSVLWEVPLSRTDF